MTETRLRTWTHLAGYLLATLFIVMLASQNLRYGLYELFYLAAGLALLTLGGAVYTLVSRRQQLRAPGHLMILAAVNALVLAAVVTLDRPYISHWCLPLLVLNFIILPLRQGITLSLALTTGLILFLLVRLPLAEALPPAFAAVILTSVAALYIWHYDHMAQSAEDLAITDPLTGAHNARFLDETLQKEISRSEATGHPLSAIMLAVDYADEAEDLHGVTGMQTLGRALTQHLFGVIRAGDTLYSLRTGEFFLILPFTPEDGVRVIAERIRRTVAEHSWPVAGKITISLGCTTRTRQDTRSTQLRERAAQALGTARKRGHDTIWYSTGESRQP